MAESQRQSLTADTGNGVWKALVIVGSLLPIAAGIWLFASQRGEREAAMQQAANLAAFCGRTMQRPDIEAAMEKFRATTTGWPEAGKLFATTYGCVPK